MQPPAEPPVIAISTDALNALQPLIPIRNDSVCGNSGVQAGKQHFPNAGSTDQTEISVLGDFLGASSLDQLDMSKLGMPPPEVVLALFRACELQLPKEHGSKLSAAKKSWQP